MFIWGSLIGKQFQQPSHSSSSVSHLMEECEQFVCLQNDFYCFNLIFPYKVILFFFESVVVKLTFFYPLIEYDEIISLSLSLFIYLLILEIEPATIFFYKNPLL